MGFPSWGEEKSTEKKKSAACKLTELRIPSLTHRQASKKGQNSQNTNPRLSTVLSHLQTFMVSQKHILFRKMMGFFSCIISPVIQYVA